MGLEDLRVPSITIGEEHFDRGCNDNEQSLLVEAPTEHVLIVRELENGNTELPLQEEVARRKAAVDLHAAQFSEFTQDQQLMVLQGENDGRQVPLLGRFVKQYREVRKTSDMTLREIFTDPELCEASARINFRGLKILLKEGKVIDPGVGLSRSRENGKGVIETLVRAAKSSNIFKGTSEDGREDVFVDPDWYVQVPEEMTRLEAAKYGVRFASLALVYGAASKLSKVRARLIPQQKIAYHTQHERSVRKQAS